MSKDVISYKQKIIHMPEEHLLNKIKTDENLMLILTALRKRPMTVKDLIEEFKEQGFKKSDKSIYRYLKELIDSKLVARAGKRITSVTEKDLQSETVYIRTAKIFITGSLKYKESKLGSKKTEKLFELIYAILNKRFPDRIRSVEGVKNLLYRFDSEKYKLVVEMFQNADESIFKQESELDWGLVEYLIEYVGWLALLLEFDVEEEIANCCP
ncbi:MAG: hypothetical protein ACTSQB_07240 [Candidatus Heimdallarchaeota archaeon]